MGRFPPPTLRPPRKVMGALLVFLEATYLFCRTDYGNVCNAEPHCFLDNTSVTVRLISVITMYLCRLGADTSLSFNSRLIQNCGINNVRHRQSLSTCLFRDSLNYTQIFHKHQQGKISTVTGLRDLEGSRMLRLPDFLTLGP